MASSRSSPNSNPSSSLSMYLEEMGRFPLLNEAQKKEIDEILLHGDASSKEQARKKLIQHNLRLVIPVAEKYRRYAPSSYMDLIQDGNLALSVAAKNYKPGLSSFSTYATYCIESYLKDSVRADPTYALTKGRRIAKARVFAAFHILKDKLGRNPSSEDIAELLGRDYEIALIDELLQYPFSSQEDALEEAEGGDDVVSSINQSTTLEQVDISFAKLNEKEQFVLDHYFGLRGEKKLSLSEIGVKLGVSKERARQIKETALFKLETH